MNLSKADLAMLGRRAQQPVKAEGDVVAIFVPGILKNPLNAYDLWVKRVAPRYKREWKERVANALLETGWRHHKPGEFSDVRPKSVTFLARVHQLFDTDGLEASLKACRDALVECGVIHSDAPDSRHVFTYAQRIDRKNRGVEIRVRLT